MGKKTMTDGAEERAKGESLQDWSVRERERKRGVMTVGVRWDTAGT